MAHSIFTDRHGEYGPDSPLLVSEYKKNSQFITNKVLTPTVKHLHVNTENLKKNCLKA